MGLHLQAARFSYTLALVVLSTFLGCGDSSKPVPAADASPPTSFQVGGNVSGLDGELSLALNNSEVIGVQLDGPFNFSTELQAGETYLVDILEQPSGQSCAASNNSGTISGINVSDVSVTCVYLDAALANLEFSGVDATVSPVFSPGQLLYATNVSVLVSEVSLVPTAVDANATISINGIAVATGTPSAPFPLGLGTTSVTIEVVGSSGNSQTYVVDMIRGGDVIKQVAYGKASNTESSDIFGRSVAVFGDTLAVGASGESSNATGIDGDQADNSASDSGAVYVFKRTGTSWDQEAYIKAPSSSHRFGSTVALSADTLIVGAPTENGSASGINGTPTANNGTRSGAVYVYRRAGTSWSHEAYIKASNPDPEDGFGVAVSLSGDTLAVSARSEDSSATGVNGDQTDNSTPISGAVYIFRRSGTTWAQEAYIKSSNSESGDGFGFYSIALFGDLLAVGAIGEQSGATGVDGDQTDNSVVSSGAVYLFRRTNTSWAQEAYIKASNPDQLDGFGASVALSEDYLAIGATLEDSSATGIQGNQDDNLASNSGAVYLFRRTASGWVQEAYVKASNTRANDEFGVSVALGADILAVGARHDSINATGIDGSPSPNLPGRNSGAVYVFRKTDTSWAQEAYVKASNTDAGDNFGNYLSLSGDTLAIGALLEDSTATGIDGTQASNSAPDSGAVYLFQ